MTARNVRIAVYADVNLNVIDGSAIWLQSIATVLARDPRNQVTILLKAGVERDLLTRPLAALEGVSVVNPVDDGDYPGPALTKDQALDTLERLDAEQRFDAVLLRSLNLCYVAATRESRAFHGRMWPYITEMPQHFSELTERSIAVLERIASASRYVLCQTESLRVYLESHVPGVAGKAILLPPMIPDEITEPDREQAGVDAAAPLKLVYVGKYAPLWNTLEMTQVVARLRRGGLPVELHMVGDKIHDPVDSPDYHDRMETALKHTDGVIWHGGKSRQEAQAMLADFHVALGWRQPELDESLELSTKLLEYGAAGLPVIANRNPTHEQLYGADYPLFANSTAGFEQAITAARDDSTRHAAAERCGAATASFTFAAVAEQMQAYMERAVPRRDLRESADRPLRVLVACHDFKFFTRIQEHLAAIRGLELRADAWAALSEHDEQVSEELCDWADVVICEWCADNAIWYSKHKREHQRLIVRLHRFELYGRYVNQLEFANVDRVVFVDAFYRDEAIARLGWAAEKLVVIPNWVDTRLLDRPKEFGAFFNLGMIGIAPSRKRLDRGIGVLERLRRADDRFQLFVKTKMPWEYPWIWAEPDEEQHYRAIFAQLDADERLGRAVHFDRFGPDVPSWLRKIGFVLSTSDDESFHLAPAEGMASRALPLLLDWQGVEAIYPPEWIHANEEEMVDTILSVRDQQSWQRRGEEVREYVEERYSVERVCDAWADLVIG